MKRTLSLILAVLTVISCSCLPSFGAAAEASKKYTVIAQLNDAPLLTAAGRLPGISETVSLLKKLNASRASTLKSMSGLVKNFEVIHSYTHLINAVSFKATKSEMQAIKALPGVKSAFISPEVRVTAEPAANGDISSGSMIGLEKMRKLGLDGTGTAIAIIDGGLDVDHEAMKLTDESTAKLSKSDIAAIIKANDMGSENINADDVYKNAKVPFAFDYCEEDADVEDDNNSAPDHGTHVSGIAAGNGGRIRGVAPEAQILMFKIDVYDDNVFLDNLLAAIDDAAKFGVSSINMSVGMSFAMPDDPEYELISEAITNARNNGITVCCSAGNEGAFTDSVVSPDYATSGIPGGISASTSVASIDNVNLSQKVETHEISGVKTDDGTEYEAYSLNSDYFNNIPKSAGLVPVKMGGSYDLEGKAALIFEHTTKSDAAAASAYLSIFSNSEPDMLIVNDNLYSTALEIVREIWMPVILVSERDAFDLYHNSPVTVSPVYNTLYAEPASVLEASYYSSYGLNDNVQMTVDVAAPGGIIYSSVANDKYDVYSGTSMASPHVAGAAALLDQYINVNYPSATGADRANLKENLLMSTADPVIYNGCAVSPRLLGAGLINLPEAVSTNTILTDGADHSALNIGEVSSDEFTLSFTAVNLSASPVTYDGYSVDVITDKAQKYTEFNNETGKYDEMYVLTGESTALTADIISSSASPLTLAPGESREISVNIKLSADELEANSELFTNGFFVEGYVYLTDSTNTETPVNMPFVGFYGDWYSQPALTIYEEDGIAFFAERQIKQLDVTLTNAETGKEYSFTEEYLCRETYLPLTNIIYRNVDNEFDEGKYTVTVSAHIAGPEGKEQEQQYTCKTLLSIDNTPAEIISITSAKRADGGYDITVVADSDDIETIELIGARVSNRHYYDIFFFDEPVSKTDEGYVYTVRTFGEAPGSLCIVATDSSGNIDQWGRVSFLASLLLRIENFFSLISTLFSALRK